VILELVILGAATTALYVVGHPGWHGSWLRWWC
jgi:hypothetical protein